MRFIGEVIREPTLGDAEKMPLNCQPPRIWLSGPSRSRKQPAPWWVYAAIGGAAVAGAVTIWATSAGENRQRIELTFP